ncbi:hypothetical protein SAMN06269185_3078 [Natronoarchaeum philippinense]|uniref:DUF8052 domain-containing protein n=1 Tax=Natronoarchaeum philippinense TaxID=558529 RepID=A0A285PCU8_NATPI|nr:hypothetical protein [Natronoarchaeum philippinense]SNZ17671.1 hypothetical protein SAMN06269185_3078 [Natronoarchaeum philippinense]
MATSTVSRPPATADAIPDWDDEYLDGVAARLARNYDLARDVTVDDEPFALYARMDMESRKHFLHPSIAFAHHEVHEHLFARRVDSLYVVELEHLVGLCHDLADDWIEPDEEHYGTEFTVVIVAPTLTDDVRSFVKGFRDRTLIKYGYHGHYEINLVVAAPSDEELVASENADVRTAFETWDPIEREEPGLLDLIARRLQL